MHHLPPSRFSPPRTPTTPLSPLPMVTLVQALVFVPPPQGCRRIIVATNVAETSITVDGVVYVVDPGMVKQKSYSPQTGLDSLAVVPISR